MRKILFTFVLFSVLSSCNKEPQPLTKAEVKQKIDSLTKIRIIQSDVQAKRDLEDRMKIEVKVKVDSIVNARLALGKADTSKKPKVSVPPPPGVPFMAGQRRP